MSLELIVTFKNVALVMEI